MFHTMSLMSGLSVLGEAARLAAGRPGSFQFQETLGETLEGVPSSLLARIDSILVRSIKPPSMGDDQSGYQMMTLINGLVFVRVVEVSRPSLAARAHGFRGAALSFMEPLFGSGMQMMRSSMKDEEPQRSHQTPKEKLSVSLAALGITVDPDQEDNQFCIAATMKMTRLVMENAGANPASFDDIDAFIAGLFSFTIADVVTRQIGGTFEIVSSVAAGFVTSVRDDPERQGLFVRELIEAFNGRASASTVTAIGRTTISLLNEPTDKELARLAGLFELSRKHAA
ncbi:MAG: hypothetical protein AB7T86_05070 [Xanthobacteraceae bacterium]